MSQYSSDLPTTFEAIADRAYREAFRVRTADASLRAVLEETLESKGGLTRLKLALLVADIVNLPVAEGRALATAVEYFHTASLLLDDLPCMDNASERRGMPCAHRRHGEASAVLGALAFINRAYALLGQAFAPFADPARSAAARHACLCLGEAGVLGGQALDLHFGASDRSPRAVGRAAIGKTVTLLRLTLVTPALLAGVDREERLLIDRLSVYWGLAYQIADDCADLTGGADTGKTAGRDELLGRPNLVLAAGPVATVHRLGHLLSRLESTLHSLEAIRPKWSALQSLVTKLVRASSSSLSVPAATTPDRRCA